MIEIQISNRIIGKNQPCFVIAEAGVNHNGNISLAKQLVDAASEAKADAVKFQTYLSEELVTSTTEMAQYQIENTGKTETQQEMLKKLELKEDDFKDLKNYCDKKNIIFMSTPHTESAVDLLNDIVPAFKLASGDLTNTPLLEKVAETKKPIILSTGMANMQEIEQCVTVINQYHNNIILLHCTSEYPTKLSDVNLATMQTIEEKTGKLVGYSDHTEGIDVSLMAAKLGAVLIEKHFTVDKKLSGPDHKASLNLIELKELVTRIKNKDYPEIDSVVMGSSEKKPTKVEEANALLARKSIVAKETINKGKIISSEMLTTKRPGTGLSPNNLKNIIGKVAKEDIKKDTLIKNNHFEEA